MIMLIDCNNFYASCEALFNPSIKNKPVVVLSSNDGCIISRNPLSKKLGIAMGVPVHEVKEIIDKHDVSVFSSNYTLYGDISDRVMTIISSFVPEVEFYSIDEAFCDMSSYPDDILLTLGNKVRDTIRQWIGITVSVGIARTKVLAKVANKIAKKGSGVMKLTDPSEISNALSTFPVDELWGIGRQYSLKLRAINVTTALQMRELPLSWVKKNMTVNGERIHLELHEISCIPVEQFQPAKKAIGSARSFGRPVTTLSELKEALSSYLSTCAVKLRAQGSSSTLVTIFLQTNYFNKTDRQYSCSRTIHINATNLTPVLLKYSNFLLEQMYLPEYKYKRVGIILQGLVPAVSPQIDLFEKRDVVKLEKIQKTVDILNRRFSRDQVRFACQGFQKRWKMKQEKLSPQYTTNFKDILTIDVDKYLSKSITRELQKN